MEIFLRPPGTHTKIRFDNSFHLINQFTFTPLIFVRFYRNSTIPEDIDGKLKVFGAHPKRLSMVEFDK